MWAAASENYCFLFGREMMTSQTAVSETTENVELTLYGFTWSRQQGSVPESMFQFVKR